MSMIKDSLKALFTGRSGICVIRNAKISKNAYIRSGSRFYSSELGDYSYLGRNCYMTRTRVGKYCSVADNCSCGMPEHRLDTVSTSQLFLKGKNCVGTQFGVLPHPKYKTTVIENDVWIGMNVNIRAGVTIGTGAVIGMGSIVTKNVPPYAIVAGNPARIIRYRFDEETVSRLLDSKWWELDQSLIEQLAPAFDDPDKLLKKIEEMQNGKCEADC